MIKNLSKTALLLILLVSTSCGYADSNNITFMENTKMNDNKLEVATLGGGCFWCIEAIFDEIRGVESTISGYSGGTVKNPAYREVTSGRTGHAEVVQIKFNPQEISYREILEVFFHLHDPTTLNRQGADVGTQYRSVIFFHDENQEKTAREVFEETNQSGLWGDPLVTQIEPLTEFYPAEEYHQNYFAKNPDQAYCSYVIKPKLEKLRKLYKEQLN